MILLAAIPLQSDRICSEMLADRSQLLAQSRCSLFMVACTKVKNVESSNSTCYTGTQGKSASKFFISKTNYLEKHDFI